MTIELGDKVEDTITGFKGIVICVSQWLHGCRRVVVQPDNTGKDGKVPDTATFDEPQLKVLKPKRIPAGNPRTGGPRPDVSRPSISR